MMEQTKQRLKEILKVDEGFLEYPKADTRGYMTIGYGHNLDTNPISHSVASFLLEEDIQEIGKNIPILFPYFNDLTPDRQIAFFSMCFILGLKGILKFKRFLRAVERGDYKIAAEEMINSNLSMQMHDRIHRLSRLMYNK